jgi:hypothetical protein
MIEWLIKPTNWKPFGKRPVGRPKNRWIDEIIKRYGSAQGEELEGFDWK